MFRVFCPICWINRRRWWSERAKKAHTRALVRSRECHEYKTSVNNAIFQRRIMSIERPTYAVVSFSISYTVHRAWNILIFLIIHLKIPRDYSFRIPSSIQIKNSKEESTLGCNFVFIGAVDMIPKWLQRAFIFGRKLCQSSRCLMSWKEMRALEMLFIQLWLSKHLLDKNRRGNAEKKIFQQLVSGSTFETSETIFP